ncbi:MAG: T9SS type A sorting domain-containing protein, partial [bacterium]
EYCMGYNSYGNLFSCCSAGNCTWWSRFQRPDLQGICTGMARDWKSRAEQAGIPTSSTAQPGSVGCYPQDCANGHVASVNFMSADALSVYISEMACPGWPGLRYRWRNVSDAAGFILFRAPTLTSSTVSRLITECRNRNSWLGSAASSLHQWRPSGGNGYWVWIVDYSNGSVILDEVGGATTAYAVSSYFLGKWAADHGCAGSRLGCPIGDRYQRNGVWRQDFWFGYLLQGTNITPGPHLWGISRYGPGVLQGYVWNPLYSYKIASAWYVTGGVEYNGIPASGNGTLAYLHPILGSSQMLCSTAWAQDLTGGQFAEPMLIIDTQAPLYAAVVAPYTPTPNAAYELHGAIRSYWESLGNRRFIDLGYPCSNEITVSGQSYIVKQIFIRRSSGQWIITAVRYYPNGTVNTARLYSSAKSMEESPDIVNDGEPDLQLPVDMPIGTEPSILVTPNPVRENCTISLAMPHAGTASIELYDVAGRRVHTVATNADHATGVTTYLWDGRADDSQRVPTGVYFVRCTTGTTTRMQRMLLVR